jgi:phytanoyl-CoA hydroxylase
MDRLDSDIHEHFDRNGYVIVRNLLDIGKDIEPVIREYNGVLDGLANRWRDEGRLTSTHAGTAFCERLLQVVMAAEASYDLHFDISLPQENISERTPMHHGPAVFDLLRSPRLLDVVEQFVGPEIYSNPVQHTRIKLPEHQLPSASRTGLTAEVAWHQDIGVITDEADETETLTVWIPMTRATVENGCLAVLPGSHVDGLSQHCRSQNPATPNQVSIPDSLIDREPVPLPMEPGDVLFMHRQTKHSGTPNRSDEVRWSFDLRYHKIGQPTGRPWFPGFIVRSRAHPETELTDAEAWAESWRQARTVLTASNDIAFNRWKANDPGCA